MLTQCNVLEKNNFIWGIAKITVFLIYCQNNLICMQQKIEWSGFGTFFGTNCHFEQFSPCTNVSFQHHFSNLIF